MKNKLIKNYLILFLFGTTFVSCSLEEDYIEKQNQSTARYKIQNKSYNDLLLDKKVGTIAKNYPRKNTIKNNILNKTISSTENDFYIDTEKSKYMEDSQSSYSSYTFTVFRNENENSNYLENLVIAFPEENYYRMALIKYKLTEQDLQNINNGINIDYKSRIVSVTPVNDSNLISDAFSKFQYTEIGNCISISHISCTSGEHNDGTGYDDCTALQVEYLGTFCPPSGGGTNSSDDNYNDSYVPYIDGINEGGGGSGNQPTNGDENDTLVDIDNTCKGCGGIITSPLPDLEETLIDTPCNQLKNSGNKTVYKQDMSTTTEKQLLTDTKNEVASTGSCYNSGDEKGNVIVTENITNAVIPFAIPAESVGLTELILVDASNNLLNTTTYMHTHGTMHYSVPSLDDIYSIYAMIKKGNITDTNYFTFYTLSAYGTVYALRIENKNSFVSWGDTFFGDTSWNNDQSGTIKRLRNDQFKMAGVKEPKNVSNFYTPTYVENSEKGLAKFLKTSGNNGIGLYLNTDGNFNNWSKIEMNNNGQKVVTPCP